MFILQTYIQLLTSSGIMISSSIFARYLTSPHPFHYCIRPLDFIFTGTSRLHLYSGRPSPCMHEYCYFPLLPSYHLKLTSLPELSPDACCVVLYCTTSIRPHIHGNSSLKSPYSFSSSDLEQASGLPRNWCRSIMHSKSMISMRPSSWSTRIAMVVGHLRRR